MWGGQRKKEESCSDCNRECNVSIGVSFLAWRGVLLGKGFLLCIPVYFCVL